MLRITWVDLNELRKAKKQLGRHKNTMAIDDIRLRVIIGQYAS